MTETNVRKVERWFAENCDRLSQLFPEVDDVGIIFSQNCRAHVWENDRFCQLGVPRLPARRRPCENFITLYYAEDRGQDAPPKKAGNTTLHEGKSIPTSYYSSWKSHASHGIRTVIRTQGQQSGQH